MKKQPNLTFTKPLAWGSAIGLSLFSFGLAAAQAKHVAVSPQDMSAQQMAKASDKGLFSHSTMLPINSSSSNTVHKVFIDAAIDSQIVFISPDAQAWKMTIINPAGKILIDERSTQFKALKVENIAMGNKNFKGKQLKLKTPVTGEWQVELTPQDGINKRAGTSLKQQPSQGYLMVKGDADYKLYSYLDNNLTVKGNNINVVAYMVTDKNREQNRQIMTKKPVLQSSISKAYATITTPSKNIINVPLNDSGLNGDQYAGDGLYSAKVPTSETGVYTSQVQVTGTRMDGLSFSRTTTDIYPIEEANFELTGQAASLQRLANNKSLISIPVKQLNDDGSIYMSAEVWGINSKGANEAAAWVGGVVSSNKVNDQTTLSLSFDTRWLARNELKAPYTLKSIRLQTVNTNVPVAVLSQLAMIDPSFIKPVKGLNKFARDISNPISKTITTDMLMGNAPTQSITSSKATNPKLLLVHGYCSGNVWNTSNFSNSVEFKDYDANRTNEEFAQQIITFGAPYTSYGVVAHSQGGAAALHLYSRYWSGLDYATGGRIIQSVGTPYQGTSLAGNIAAIGAIFGIQCGSTTDLTYSGASNWLSTIPSWARSQVDYYTTSFTDKWWRYDYCHIASDLILSDPDDGTTEKWSGQLSGAVNKGHKTGWCHTSGMRDTAQTKDTSRNSSMSSRASR